MSSLMRILVGGFAAMVIATTAFAWPAEEVVAAPSTGRTEVSIFNPPVPNAPVREGYCWTSSIAARRAGAWSMHDRQRDPGSLFQHARYFQFCDLRRESRH